MGILLMVIALGIGVFLASMVVGAIWAIDKVNKKDEEE